MNSNAVLRKALNQAAFALSQREFARIRAQLEQELAVAQTNGATEEELLTVIRARVTGLNDDY